MKIIFRVVFAVLIASAAGAQEAPETIVEGLFLDGTEVDLNEFVWIKRPVVVFADSAFDPRFVTQMEYLHERPEFLAERDVVVLTDTDPSAQSALRERLRPRGFMLVLISKDGTILLRKPMPYDVREISRSIDKLPARQQEMHDRREGS